MKHQDDASASQEYWPILQSIAPQQAGRPAPLSAAEKEARWHFQPQSSLQKWSAAPSMATEKAHQIASQLRHLATSTQHMNAAHSSAQVAASDSLHAVFQRLAKGEQKPPAQPGDSRLTVQALKR
ncbi:hypothetical protein [Undibacterium umbellatum]|uniref:Uncharacterized protein n=1 Tax=Undibacterium umbellatum TaxID=2762300 RepID=A0ABR6Z5R2_9BURK|nr:hypothetical protein [Undibacterium umbellatum]MBC3907114.1 hypothetical protein [Undibacterium umbellatum]